MELTAKELDEAHQRSMARREKRQERRLFDFEETNHYAVMALNESDPLEAQVLATLALAYETFKARTS